MKSSPVTILIAFAIMVGVTGFFLGGLQSSLKLGQPGLKLVAEELFDENKKLAATNAVFLPPQVGQFNSTPLEVTRMELDWLPADTTYGRKRYTAPNQFVADVSVVLMGRDRTSIHKPQYCLTGQGFKIEQTERDRLVISKPQPYELPVMKLTTRKLLLHEGQRIEAVGIYVYWFVSEDQLTEDHLTRMWWMARDMVQTGTLKRWAYVTVFSLCHPGQEQATYDRMKAFITEAVPAFQTTAGINSALQGTSNPALARLP